MSICENQTKINKRFSIENLRKNKLQITETTKNFDSRKIMFESNLQRIEAHSAHLESFYLKNW